MAQITRTYNGIRSGDELVKQQVEYKDPGREGQNVIWDFGKLQSINDEYTLSYSLPYLSSESTYVMGKDTIKVADVNEDNQYIIGIEHNTMYYYQQKNNELLLLGHENPTTLLQYVKPMVVINYPMNFDDQITNLYTSEGAYSSRIAFTSQGQNQIKADSYGMMILPSGDTLKHVLRTKTIQTINELIKGIGDQKDIEVNTILETYKWYAKGYRYPIFETVQVTDQKDTVNAEPFSTAFFFPPQEHLYLDNDPENSAVLDSLWNIEVDKDRGYEIIPPTNDDLNFTYNFYPNPVVNTLTIEYYLERNTDVNISILNISGQLIKTLNKPRQVSGIHIEQIDFSTYTSGTYIISISTGKNVYSNKIIKR